MCQEQSFMLELQVYNNYSMLLSSDSEVMILVWEKMILILIFFSPIYDHSNNPFYNQNADILDSDTMKNTFI